MAVRQEVEVLGGELEDARLSFGSASHQATEPACVRGRDF